MMIAHLKKKSLPSRTLSYVSICECLSRWCSSYVFWGVLCTFAKRNFVFAYNFFISSAIGDDWIGQICDIWMEFSVHASSNCLSQSLCVCVRIHKFIMICPRLVNSHVLFVCVEVRRVTTRKLHFRGANLSEKSWLTWIYLKMKSSIQVNVCSCSNCEYAQTNLPYFLCVRLSAVSEKSKIFLEQSSQPFFSWIW